MKTWKLTPDHTKKFTAIKPSTVKEIHWVVGEEYVVCKPKPEFPSSQFVVFEPAQQSPGFSQTFVVPLETFRDCFKPSES